ncbi:MAG: MmgE/PrpD family protein [Casimicrobium sp.]
MKFDRTGDLAASVARFVCSAVAPDAATLDRAKIVISDTLAATVAGSTSDVVVPLHAYVNEQSTAQGDKIILGSMRRTSSELSALVNATMAAALEFDDVMSLMPAHPSAVVMAALMATDAALNAPGQAVIKAYAVGVEAGVRIAQAMTLDHYKRGFHATGTLTLFSAVCAIGRIRQLPENEFRRALGIAGSMASGLQGNFGTMTKPLHSGWAARNAIAAVELARFGLTASEQIFEAEGGFFSAYGSDASNAERIPVDFGKPWAFDEPGITLKLFPCCYASHRGMDALIKLMHRMGIDRHQVKAIRCKAPLGGLIPLKFSAPKTQFESLFSLPYALAVTALDGMPGLKSFDLQRVQSTDVAEMLKRITVVESIESVADYPGYEAQSYGSRGEVRVELEALDGRIDTERVRIAPGHPERPMSWEQAEQKFIGCLAAAEFASDVAPKLFPLIRHLETVPVFRTVVDQLSH